MRRHALVLLTVLALVAPAAPAAGGGSGRAASTDANAEASSAPQPDARLEPGRQFMRRGDYLSARQFYADTAAQSPDLAPQALVLQARAALADGDTDTAESVLQQMLSDYPTSDQLASAYFTL